MRAWKREAAWAAFCWFASSCSGTQGSPRAAVEPADGGGAGTGTADGSFSGRPFQAVASAYWIGKPDDAAHTRVIYIFDKPVACAELSKTGWDTHVADGTQSLELKLVGTRTGDYPVASNGRPATGQSDVNMTLTSRTDTPNELSASGGQVVVDELVEGVSASGSFDLTFSSGHVLGTFQAAYCAAGREP